MELTDAEVDRVVTAALTEDVGTGDRTTVALVPADTRCRAQLLLEEPGVVCGVAIAAAVFRAVDPSVHVESLVEDGTAVTDMPALLAEIEGPARAVLTGERVALNLLGRLCGIASLTRRYVELRTGPVRRSSTRARRRQGCARWRSTPCAAAAARTTAPACTTRSSSRRTTCASPAGSRPRSPC